MTLSLLRLAEQGEVGSAAGTALAAAMKDIYTPTEQAQKAMNALGVSAYENGKALDFNEVVNRLSASLSGLSDEQANAYKQTIFGIQGLNAFNKMAVTGTETQSKWAEALSDASAGMGEAAKQYGTMTDNLQGDLDSLSSAYEGVQIVVSDVLTPSVREFVQLATSGLSDATAAIKENGLGGAVEVIGPFIDNALGMLLETIPKVVALGGELLGAVVTGVVDNLPKLAEGTLQVVDAFGGYLIDAAPSIADRGAELLDFFTGGLIENADAVVDAALNLLDMFAGAFADGLPRLAEAAMDIVEALAAAVSDPNAIANFAQSGLAMLDGLVTSILDSLPRLAEAAVNNMVIILIFSRNLRGGRP